MDDDNIQSDRKIYDAIGIIADRMAIINPHDGTGRERGYSKAEACIRDAQLNFGYWALHIGFIYEEEKNDE